MKTIGGWTLVAIRSELCEFFNMQDFGTNGFKVLIGNLIQIWKFPISIAMWFVPRSDDSRYPKINMELQSLEIVSFTIIGVYILSWAIPDLVANIGLLWVVVGDSMYSEQQLGEVKVNTFVTIVEILIGVVLCVYSGNISKFIAALRR